MPQNFKILHAAGASYLLEDGRVIHSGTHGEVCAFAAMYVIFLYNDMMAKQARAA